MGRDNRARRAAKAKSRASGHGGRAQPRSSTGASGWSASGPSAPAGWSTDESSAREHERRAAEERRRAAHEADVFDLWSDTATQMRRGHWLPGMQALAAVHPAVADHQAEVALLLAVGRVWTMGWQPAELHRQARLGSERKAAAQLIGLAMATDHAIRPGASLDRRWMAQFDGLGLPVVDGRPGWLARWAPGLGLSRAGVVTVVLDALANLVWLPRLEPILPPPGAEGSGPGAVPPPSSAAGDPPTRGAESNPMLDKIRNLLAKAESTTFEAEATAFTAKAQELMTRHAIDAALVGDRAKTAGELPVQIRVPIDAPYVDAKALLLQTVASAGRCRTVLIAEVALSTVIGFADDVAAVELLFTSLLVQAQSALAEAARRAPAGTRTRSQSYRQSFLTAFTHRIGQRLEEINAAVYAEVAAERGGDFLPVLRSRAEVVDDYLEERFGTLRSMRTRRSYDGAGWASGQAAADKARLTSGEVASG